MLNLYDIVPTMLTSDLIEDFLAEIEKNESYQDYIEEWKSLKNAKKDQEIERMELAEAMRLKDGKIFPFRHMCFLKPYIELFTDYLQKNHIDEIQKSHELISIADLSMPWNWFPETREKYPKRQFHFHMGPTNSGKTKTALDYLRKAKTGCYLSPLRLLALEIQQLLIKS